MALDLKRYRDVVGACVGRIMNSEVVTVGPDDPCEKAVALLLKHRVAALPVVDAEGQLLGVLSQTELMQPLNLEKQVRDVFSHHVPTVQSHEPITRLIHLFQSQRFRCIPVVNQDKKVLGVVSRHEVLAYYAMRF